MVLNKKYKGNTLPEILIAIVIISFTSVMGVTIYLNIQQNTRPFIKLKATELANEYLEKSLKANNYFDESFKEEEFLIKKTVARIAGYPDCVLIKVSVSASHEKKISEVQKIMYVN